MCTPFLLYTTCMYVRWLRLLSGQIEIFFFFFVMKDENKKTRNSRDSSVTVRASKKKKRFATKTTSLSLTAREIP